MTIRAEYCTVTELRATYLKATGTGDDVLLLGMIRAISRDIDDLTVKRHHPRLETRYFSLPYDGQLDFGENWLLGVTTLTNGDGDAIASTDYNLQPRNDTPYHALRLKDSSSVVWAPDADGNVDDVIALAGVWGFHRDYAHAWETLTTLAAPGLTDSATSATLTAAGAQGGELWKIDSEYIYAGAVTTTAATALLRGVNGSTAAAHIAGATIYRWAVGDSLSLLCKQAAAATYKLRDNPSGEAVSIDGHEFRTPRDVRPWLLKQMQLMGLVALS